MKILSLIIAFLFAGVLPLFAAPAQNQPQENVEPEIPDVEAFEMENSHLDEKSLEYKKKIIANDFFEKAFSATTTEDKILFYQRSVEFDPDNADAHNNLGIIHKKYKKYDLALDSYNKALEIPGYSSPEITHNNLGVLYKDLERYDEAIEQFKKAITYRPSFAKAWNNMGLAYKGNGMFDKAGKCFQKAISLQPDFMQAEDNLKNVWKIPKEKSPRQKKIESLYTKALKLFREKKIEAAIPLLLHIKNLNPNYGNVQADLELAQNHRSFNSRIKKADQFIQQGSFILGRRELYLAKRFARTEELKGRLARMFISLDEREKNIARNSQVTSIYNEGLDNLQQEQWLKAISKFARIMLLNHDYKDVQMLNRQARVGFYLSDAAERIGQGQWNDARIAYQSLLNIDPQNEEALKGLEELTQKKNKATIEYHLREAGNAVNFKDMEVAERNFKEVLKIDPQNKLAQGELKRINAAKPVTVKSSAMELPSDKEELGKMAGVVIGSIVVFILLIRTLRPGKVLQHYRKLKDLDNTRVFYERILDMDPQRQMIYPSLASLYCQLRLQKKLPSLLELCQQQMGQAQPQNTPLWQFCLGKIYLENKQFDQAQQEMEKAYDLAPGLDEINEKLIEVYKVLAQKSPDNDTWQQRLKELEGYAAGDDQLPIVQRSQTQNIADMDEDAKRAFLKECFGHKDRKASSSNSSKTEETKTTTQPKIHQTVS